MPGFAETLPYDLAAGYRERAERAQAAWADDAALTRVDLAPFGPLPGAQVVGVYVSEQLTHGWDLAVATGRPATTSRTPTGTGYGQREPANGFRARGTTR